MWVAFGWQQPSADVKREEEMSYGFHRLSSPHGNPNGTPSSHLVRSTHTSSVTAHISEVQNPRPRLPTKSRGARSHACSPATPAYQVQRRPFPCVLSYCHLSSCPFLHINNFTSLPGIGIRSWKVSRQLRCKSACTYHR